MAMANLSGVVSTLSLALAFLWPAHRGQQADPELTPIGKDQAIVAQQEWNTELPFGLPVPRKLYCSPLTRALQTCEITFREIMINGSVVIVEVFPSIVYTLRSIHFDWEPELP
jgi:broad specificity phosphatase PhoE